MRNMKEIVGEAQFEKEVLTSPRAIAVVFSAHWCPFCRAFMPVIEKRLDDFPDPIVAVILDDWNDPLWDRCSIQVVPSLAVFKGGKLVFRIDGVLGVGLAAADIDRLVEHLGPGKNLGGVTRKSPPDP